MLIVSTQEDDNMQPSFDCRIRMRVGYGENGKITTTILTTIEEVDCQFWSPGRNKVIKELKHIKINNYSCNDGFNFESETAKSTNSPKIYDLSTPQKKSRKTEMYSDVTSDKLVDLSKDDNYMQSGRIWDSKPTKPSTSKKHVSNHASKNTAVSLLDMILLEESHRDKHSKTGTVIKLKDCTKNFSFNILFQAEKSSSSHKHKRFENARNRALKKDFNNRT